MMEHPPVPTLCRGHGKRSDVARYPFGTSLEVMYAVLLIVLPTVAEESTIALKGVS